eukprot:TRINITY_DN636_c0_g2_i1.p1 TRINITY_DN636_c0_g2~~TRINITY_DN636_c0_g2_i1.p1  ORF type:complete len:331 (+),score=59.08 TRINITY_DN636_c0_g2_i1:212-1204(+)
MAAAKSSQEFTLPSPPTDGVSNVTFSPSDSLLLASSWDTSVRLYDVSSNAIRTQYNHKAAVLDCCFADNTTAFSGGVDKTVQSYDFNTSTQIKLGEHDAPVKCLQYCASEGILVSGSWDQTVRLWDSRQSHACVQSASQPGKVYALGMAQNTLVVGTSGRHINIWDIRKMNEPQQSRTSSLRFQTRTLAAFPDATGYAVGSVEGRVAIEYFDPSPAGQKKKYAFKCHRRKENGVENIYPVNTIAFHPVFGTFCTGGGDGIVSVWDGANKKRLFECHRFQTSIASTAFNADGTLLAIAVSYTYEEGEREHPADSIIIRNVAEKEVKPKPKR